MVVLVRVGVGIDAVVQVTGGHFVIRTEKPVPVRKNIAVIGVRNRQYVMVVYVMHIRRHDKQTEHPVSPMGKFNIGVVELRQPAPTGPGT